MSPEQTPPNLDFLAQMMAQNKPSTAQEMRAMLAGLAGFLNGDLPAVGAFHEKVLVRDVDGARVTTDVVVPTGSGPHPVLVYLHGGGWVAGSPETHRRLGHRFAEAGYLVFNVDYRLAPEHPFPAPFDDCVHAIRWAAAEAERYGGDATRLAVGGDSAGGNLSAAAAASLADEEGAPSISALLLIYGLFDFATIGQAPQQDPTLAELGDEMIELMRGSYIGSNPSDGTLADPRVSPIHAVAKLPPSYVLVGEADPLVSDAQRMADGLAKADIAHEHVVVPGMPHGFAQMEMFPQARESIDRMVGFLRKHVG